MPNRRTSPREIIFYELNDTYLRENGSQKLTWYSPGSSGSTINKAITINILNHLTFIYCLPEKDKEYWEYSLRQDITNIIWSVWPGGGMAANACDRIIKALGLELGDEE